MEDEGHLGCPSELSFELIDNISRVLMYQEKWKFRLLFPRINGFEELDAGLGWEILLVSNTRLKRRGNRKCPNTFVAALCDR